MIIFGSVRFLSNKSNQTEKKIKKKTETGSNRSVSVRFFREKLVQTGSTRFFQFGSVLARFSHFLVWLGFSGLVRFFFWFFFQFGFGSVQFSFFGFLLIKSKPNRTGRFFQNFNRFFFTVRFFQLFFLFSRFNQFFDFFSTPSINSSIFSNDKT